MTRSHPSLFLCLASLLFATAATAQTTFNGRIVDQGGGVLVGVTVTAVAAGTAPLSTVTDGAGEFHLALDPREYRFTISAPGFRPIDERIAVTAGAGVTRTFVLNVAGIEDVVTVAAAAIERAAATVSAAKAPTPLRDVPQAIAVVSSETIADQRMQSMADVVRYMPGVGMAQGEGNRDTPILRGNSSTGDFFIDGVRDDAQYFRDTYNVERIEAIKGPNAMIFGRGGAGGVINRVTRAAGWSPVRQLDAQLGSWGDRRITADLGGAPSSAFAARVMTIYETSDSYRRGATLERAGMNPTIAAAIGSKTLLRASYEFFRDRRTADRGVPSTNGRPVDTDPATFFGNPDAAISRADVNIASAILEHTIRPGMSVRSRTTFGHYDKFYRNLVPGVVRAATVNLTGYDNATNRRNLFNQTDLIVKTRTGAIEHTIATGVEAGRQLTANFRNTAYFPTLGSNVTTTSVPLDNPVTTLPLEFRQSSTDADNDGTAVVAAVYAQDQVSLLKSLQAVVGLRFDNFSARVTNHRTSATFNSVDHLVSPRAGLIYKPIVPVSIYANYSVSYVPRAGDQLSSLSVSNQALDPEQFRNYEIGAKWDNGSIAMSAAAYRLDRGNVAVADPNDATRSILVNAQRARGVELSIDGRITRAWTVNGGYALQDGRITRSLSTTVLAGARLAQLPAHSFSVWNKYDWSAQLAAGIGIVHRGDIFAAADNLVMLPAYTRVDGGVFWTVSPRARAQINVENVFNTRYYASAHNNTNIQPGSPRALRLALTTSF